nr:hypothetical protein [Ligilactobacillus salitolerans]
MHLAAKVTRHAHKVWVQLSSANVFDDLYWQCLFRIQHLNLIPA